MDEFMQIAIEEARTRLGEGGIPIGSILVKDIGQGHNRRVQSDDPTAQAEIECLRNAGRIGSYARHCTPFGENRMFQSSSEFMRANGIEVVDLDLDECYQMMQKFIAEDPVLWKEDIGEL